MHEVNPKDRKQKQKKKPTSKILQTETGKSTQVTGNITTNS